MTDNEIRRLRQSCDDAPPRVDGRQIILKPQIIIALLDEIERMRPVYAAAKSWRHNVPKHEVRGFTTTAMLVAAVDSACAKESR